jgi:hypothetical protein
VVLLLGLVLVTSADRLSGSPMLAVLCGGLLIGRLGLEVVPADAGGPSATGRAAAALGWSAGRRSLEQQLASLSALIQTLLAAAIGLRA